MSESRIVAVALLTQNEVTLLGPTFQRLWVVDETPCFGAAIRHRRCGPGPLARAGPRRGARAEAVRGSGADPGWTWQDLNISRQAPDVLPALPATLPSTLPPSPRPIVSRNTPHPFPSLPPRHPRHRCIPMTIDRARCAAGGPYSLSFRFFALSRRNGWCLRDTGARGGNRPTGRQRVVTRATGSPAAIAFSPAGSLSS